MNIKRIWVPPLLLLTACNLGGSESGTGTPAEEISAAENADDSETAAARNEATTPEDAPELAAAQSEDADESPTPPKRARTREETAESHGKWVRALMAAAPARVTVRSGTLKWRVVHVQTPTPSTWLEAAVVADRYCGAPEKLTVRVRYHSELANLQPEDHKDLLFVGSMDDDVLTTVWASPYEREHVPVHHVEVPLSIDDLFGACEDGSTK